MPHSYVSCLVHYVWSTKDRRNLLPARELPRLWEFIGGIARAKGMKAIAVGGTDNHVHALVSLPAAMPVAKGAQLLKAGSSKFVHETYSGAALFSWQEGYGAFSVSISHVQETAAYINGQRSRHRTRTFEEEFVAFLKRHGMKHEGCSI